MAKKFQDTICTDSSYIIPFELWDGDTACMLFEFYLYNMADSKDSPLSYGLNTLLTETQKTELLEQLLNAVDADVTSFVCAKFLNNKMADIISLELSDQTLTCNKVKGFLQSSSDSFTFDILMKRIRDSFAHGRIARSKDQAFLIFEDKTNQLTGRIILKNNTLVKWRDIIVEYRKELGMCPA